MKSPRKICVVTATRAEYGHLYWVMKEIQKDPALQLQLVVSGMHVSPEFGLTYQTIEENGFHIDEKVEVLLSSDTPVGIAKSMGIATISFAETFERLKPDIVVLLGDRFELLSAAQAAMVARFPIAHLHGGEATEALIDEAIRHSITKMSQFHFVAAQPYRKRVIQLGEHPDRVFNVGAPGLDHITRLPLFNRVELEKALHFQLGKINFLVTYHPVTLHAEKSKESMHQLLNAFDPYPDAHIIFTKSNCDTDGRIINPMIDHFVEMNPKRACQFTSLGQLRYLSAIQHVDAVIGNSSSGIIEVPAFKKPTINMGDRQQGRLRSASVIDCEETSSSIVAAIDRALSQHFQQILSETTPAYGLGNASFRIKEILKKVDLNNVVIKKFYTIPF